MWHITSGAIKGVSEQNQYPDAFLELFDGYVAATGRFPDLGTVGAASVQGFDYTPSNTIFFLTEWVLFERKRIPRMSHGFDSMQEHLASYFETLPNMESMIALTQPQDNILEATEIDAPNSRENFWDDVIDVPDDYQWATVNADTDASSSGS